MAMTRITDEQLAELARLAGVTVGAMMVGGESYTMTARESKADAARSIMATEGVSRSQAYRRLDKMAANG